MTPTIDDTTVMRLAVREPLYAAFQHAFGGDPTVELMRLVCGPEIAGLLEQVLGDAAHKNECGHALRLLQETYRRLENDPAVTVDVLKDDYTALLLGPSKPPAPPWESVYRSREGALFTEYTLEVRRAYRQQGLEFENRRHEADDHLAIEVDFMAILSKRLLDEAETGLFTERFCSLAAAQQAFLDDHLLKWVPSYTEDMQQTGRGDTYPALAILLNEFLHKDSELLVDLLGEAHFEE